MSLSNAESFLLKVHPDILGADSSDLQSIVTEARQNIFTRKQL